MMACSSGSSVPGGVAKTSLVAGESCDALAPPAQLEMASRPINDAAIIPARACTVMPSVSVGV